MFCECDLFEAHISSAMDVPDEKEDIDLPSNYEIIQAYNVLEKMRLASLSASPAENALEHRHVPFTAPENDVFKARANHISAI